MKWVRLVVMLCVGSSALADTPQRLEYNRDVRPILFSNCFSCHGPDSASRQADLRLDLRESAVAAKAIVAGDPSASKILARLTSHDETEVMPPPETKKTVTPGEIKIIEQWIREGAEYQPHWSLIPPTRPELPTVERSEWTKNAIDHFVLARLEQEGLSPNDQADKRRLARRVSLDLTGLPPSVEMVEEFVVDDSPSAYEKLVDKLLASEAWGEHRGRYWLDYARYGDTHGIHYDNYREMWSYREWVVRAFNSNMPYDQFTIENLAGDLLPDATLDQQIGSGFNRCNTTTNEGGIIDEEYVVLYARDRTDTTSQVWMGLTAGCAVCHSHKFDEFSQREFYELSAFFNNTTQKPRDGNVQNTPPIVQVPVEEDRERFKELPALITQAKQAEDRYRDEALPAMQAWATAIDSTELAEIFPIDTPHLYVSFDADLPNVKMQIDGSNSEAKLTDKAKAFAGEGSSQSIQLAGGTAAELPTVGDFAADQPFSVSAWLWLPKNNSNGAVIARMDDAQAFRGWDLWLQDNRVGSHIVSSWPNDAIKAVTKNPLPTKKWVHVAVVYDGSKKADGLNIYVDGVLAEKTVEANGLKGDTHTEVPFKIGQRNDSSPASGVAIDELRIYKRSLSRDEVGQLGAFARVASLLAKPFGELTEAETSGLLDYYLSSIDGSFPQLTAHRQELEAERVAIEKRGTIAHVMQDQNSEPEAYILNRGEYDQRLDRVTPGTPAMLPPMRDDMPKNRLGLAQWLVDDMHPLTARVTVNRCWQELFGQGLVRTAHDFGVAGELPSHPELLDWLAIEFRESGWDLKQLYKLMVMSATYRQSATTTPEKLERDPSNRLLTRGPRYRMDAEMVRDQALATSGLLVEKIGGPSVKPYQPPGIWDKVGLPGGNTRNYVMDTGDALYRRSVYTFWKRMAPPPTLEIFNAPNREHCVITRERTNTPLQALSALNDVQFVEAARHLATGAIVAKPYDTTARTQWMAERLVSRKFTEVELAVVEEVQAKLAEYYSSHADDAVKLVSLGESPRNQSIDPAELATWTMIANQLMNLDEVLCK